MNYFEKLYADLHKSPDYAAEYLPRAITGIIRRHMQQQGITQDMLAERLGVSQANIAKKLRGGQNLTLKSIAEIATALGSEWVGLELVSHEEARRQEQRAAWSRETAWSVSLFKVETKGISHEQRPVNNNAVAYTQSLSA